jgi:hypothetical protein
MGQRETARPYGRSPRGRTVPVLGVDQAIAATRASMADGFAERLLAPKLFT